MHQRAAQCQPLAQAHGQGGSQIVFVTMPGHVQNPLQAHVAGLAVQAIDTGIQADVSTTLKSRYRKTPATYSRCVT
jgi:hypothetical protein